MLGGFSRHAAISCLKQLTNLHRNWRRPRVSESRLLRAPLQHTALPQTEGEEVGLSTPLFPLAMWLYLQDRCCIHPRGLQQARAAATCPGDTPSPVGVPSPSHQCFQPLLPCTAPGVPKQEVLLYADGRFVVACPKPSSPHPNATTVASSGHSPQWPAPPRTPSGPIICSFFSSCLCKGKLPAPGRHPRPTDAQTTEQQTHEHSTKAYLPTIPKHTTDK